MLHTKLLYGWHDELFPIDSRAPKELLKCDCSSTCILVKFNKCKIRNTHVHLSYYGRPA